MTDQTQAQNPADTGQQPAPMPSAEQTQVTQPAEQASPQGDSAPGPQVAEPSLPDGTTDRTTEQFDKLKKQLTEEREKRLSYERLLSRPDTKTQQQPQPETPKPGTPSWYNADSGEVDVNVLQSEFNNLKGEIDGLSATNQRLVKQQDDRQARIAYKAHPELNPQNPNFNETFHKAVVGYLSTEYASGNSPTLKQAAGVIKSIGSGNLDQAKQEGVTQALEGLSPKEQASLNASGRSDNRNAAQDYDTLRRRTQQGDDAALAERLKSIPPVGR